MVELVIRVVFSLAVVFGLLWLVARTSSRRFGGAARSMVRVLARQPLARNSALAVVEVGERVLVVGVGEHGVSLLTEMEPDELPEVEAPAAPVRSGHLAGLRRARPASGPDRDVTDVPAGVAAAVRPAGINGSVLSSHTWKQAWAAATGRNGADGD